MIRLATSDDAAVICAIYNHYVTNTTITFEEDPVAPAEMAQRIANANAQHCWYVFEQDGAVAAYAYATPWRVRPAYRHSVETTVYVKPGGGGKGIGTELYTHLILQLRKRGFRAVIGGIALPNNASVALHERLGFTQVAHFVDVGHKFGKWIDVGYWELVLKPREAN
jgi:phosphinothricin acetyltransferase